MFLPKAYPIKEWTTIDRPTAIKVISKLLPKERQKSVTSIASLKLFRLHDCGKDKMPLMLFVISEGCLNAITIVKYSGKIIVESPSINKTIATLFVCILAFFFVIAAPPSFR